VTSQREESVTVAGCTVRMLRGGAGPTMLYLHGAGGLAGWAPFMDKLAGSFDLHVPEHPGFGDTEDPDWLDNIHDEAYFYLSLMDQLDLRDVHLVGMSIGGWLAAEIAVRNTARLASLTLCGASGIHVKGVAKGDFFMWEPEQRVRNCFHDQAVAEKVLAQEPTEDQQRVALRNLRTVALLAWNPRLYDPHLYKWLPRIDVPTHIVWADDDKILPLDYARAYETLIPGSKVTVIEDCGHLMHVEKPDAFAETVASFAKGAGPNGAGK
jgi:pimeloyl-ACP methyl ester carboxylesterase